MKDQILKIAGVKSEKEFYKKFPTEEAFMAKHGKTLKKAAMGSKMVKTQLQQLTDFGNPPKFQNAPYGIGLNTGTALGANPTGSHDWTMGANVPITGGTPPPTFPGGNAQGMYQVSDFDRQGIQKDIMSTMNKKQGFDLLGKLGGAQGIGNLAGGVIQGVQGEKNWKKQKKASEAAKNISMLTLRASRSRGEAPRRYYNRPEDQIINPNELFPTYGVGSNILSSAKDGAMIGGNLTEIQNMYNPGDLYSNLGYEPMSESDIVKQYKEGGYVPKAIVGDILGQVGGMSGVIGNLGGITGTGADSSGLVSSIGSIGSKLLPGAAGAALGPLSAFAQFAINDQRARTLKNNAEAAQRNLQQAGIESGIQGLQSQYAGVMKNGGKIIFSQDGSVFPDRSDYMDYEEGYQADVDKYLSNLPTSQPSSQKSETKKSEPEKTTKLNPYEGVSVYDFLQAQGKAGDYNSRKQLAKKLGIEGYKGTAEQNKQMMDMVRKSPDVLTDYVKSSSPSGGTKSKTVSTSKKEKTSSSSSKAAVTKSSEPEHVWDYKSAYDFGTPAQTFVSASSAPVNKNTPGYGKKSDPYARIVEKSVRERGMTDYSTQQYFNEQLQKTLGEIGISGLLPGVSLETTLPYYGARAIPYVTATARNARRAIPYATRAIGYENGGDLPLYDEGGWVSHTWQPQVITKFGDMDVSQIHSFATEGMDTLRTGGRITQNNMYPQDQFNFGGELQTTWGGRAEPISYNPYLPGSGETVMFEGNSHEEKDNKGRTGIGVKYGNDGNYSPYMEYGKDGIESKTDVEVERGEPAVQLPDMDSQGASSKFAMGGSLDDNLSMNVFGNLVMSKDVANRIGRPDAAGMKYKNFVGKVLSKEENKQNKIKDKASQLIDIHDDGTPFGQLAMNSAKASIDGANMNLQDIAVVKMGAAIEQNNTNKIAEMYGENADDVAKGKVKWGKAIKKAQKGATADKDVDIDKKYDPEFVNTIGFMVDYEQEGSSAGSKGYRGGGSNWGTNNPKIKSRKDAIDYYYKNYWPMVKDLPKGLKTRAFQLAVNTGDPYGEMLVASGKMSVADRKNAIREAESKGLEGLDKNKYVLNKRLKENKDDIGATVDMFKADPATYMANLDTEQYRYYNQGLEGMTDDQREFLTGYYQSVGDIANKYAGIDKSTAKTTTDKTTVAAQDKTAIQTKKDEVKAEAPQEEGVDQATADRLNDMFTKANNEKDKAKKKQLTEAFQKEFHKYFPEKAKEIILKDKDVTRKGKDKMGIKSIEDLKKKDVKTILETNEDAIFGDRTKQYNAIAQSSVKKESTKIPEDVLTIPSVGQKKDEITPIETVKTETKKKPDWLAGLNTLLPYLQRPYESGQPDLYPEMMALSMNTLEPVKAQGVQPLLETPYDISLQDQLNEITASERAAQKMSMGDPSALANIAAQSQAAKQKVLGEQFRMNQAMKSDVYGRNRATLNQAQRENLAIFADQEAKQQMAKSKTKATALEAMSSMSDKIEKRRAEERNIRLLENAFPNYRLQRNMQLTPSQLTLFDVGDTGVPAGATPPYVASGRTADSTTQTSRLSNTPASGSTVSSRSASQTMPTDMDFIISPSGIPVPISRTSSAQVPNLRDVFGQSFKTEKNGGITKKKHFNGSIVRALKNI